MFCLGLLCCWGLVKVSSFVLFVRWVFQMFREMGVSNVSRLGFIKEVSVTARD